VQQTVTTRRATRLQPRPVRPAGWWFDGVLVVGFVALTAALARGWLLDVDVAVRDWVDAHRPTPAYWAARALNLLGQGGLVLLPVTGALAVAVGWHARSIRPLLLVVAATAITGITILPIKLLLYRGYPHNEELAAPEELFSDPIGGHAYPSGHVANAVVWYGVLAVLLGALLRRTGRRDLSTTTHRLIRFGPPVVLLCTTTYLGFHWLTDSVAGLLVGIVLDRLLARVPWDDLPLPALPGGIERPAGLG
jgi:membrane-associated phospholipid phosphatase